MHVQQHSTVPARIWRACHRSHTEVFCHGSWYTTIRSCSIWAWFHFACMSCHPVASRNTICCEGLQVLHLHPLAHLSHHSEWALHATKLLSGVYIASDSKWLSSHSIEKHCCTICQFWTWFETKPGPWLTPLQSPSIHPDCAQSVLPVLISLFEEWAKQKPLPKISQCLAHLSML